MAVNDGGWKHGGFWRISDRSGRKLRNDQTRQEWTGNWVGVDEFEYRHPQDFVRGQADKQIVPFPRPPPVVDIFIGPLQTELTAAANAGDVTIGVTSSVRFAASDRIGLPLDNGTLFITTVQSTPTATSIKLNSALTFSASIGNVVTDYSAVATASQG